MCIVHWNLWNWSHRRCPIHPDDDALLIRRHFPVDVDTLLDEDQHGHRRHEGEDGVEDDAKDVQVWRQRKGNDVRLSSLQISAGTLDPKVDGED